MLTTLVQVIHVIVCLFLILVILLQAGKGGGMGAAFGGAGTQTVFGGRGAATFLSKVTAVMAFTFMLTSLLLAYWASHTDDRALRARSAATKKQEEKKQAPAKTGLGTPAPKSVQPKPAGPPKPATP